MSAGLQFGLSQMTTDGVDFEFGDSVKELNVAFVTDPGGTAFKIKLGEVETDNDLDLDNPDRADDGTVQYLTGVVEYRFSEAWGSTGLFAGGGGYRQKFGDLEESDFGAMAGVNGVFPVTRRFGIVGELAYHWANFEESRQMLTASVGVRVGF